MKKFFDLKNYECKGIIGEGSFGKVYQVTEISSCQNYVAKIFKYEMKEEEINQEGFIDLYREIKLMSSFNHRSILRFVGYSPKDFEGQFHPTIITEYASKGSLKKILEDEVLGFSKPGWDMTKKLINIYGIAHGMKYLHSHSIFHRDLKPDNILLDEYLHPLISNFGLSKITEGGSESLIYQSISGLKGTPIYCSPEYLTSSIFTESSDVYAFGLIVYEMMTGLVPFADIMDKVTLYNKVCNEGYRPELTSEIPPAYKDLIERCWSQNPEERPSFSDIVSELEETDNGFIIDTIDESEFYEYCEFLNEYESTFELDNSIHFNNFLQSKSKRNNNHRKNTLRRSTIYKAPNSDLIKPTIIDKPNILPINDDEKSIKNESSQKVPTNSTNNEKVLDSNKMQQLNKKESTPKEKHAKRRWSIQRNKKKSTPIKSIPESNTPKIESTSVTTKGDPSDPIVIGLFGGSGCGKICITLRFIKDEYTEGYIPTIDDNFSKVVEIDGKPISVILYDTGGQDDFSELRYTSYFKCDCFVLLFSIYNPSSIDAMYSIYNDIEDALGSNLNKKPIVIAANHCDLRDQQDKFDLVPVDQYKNIEDKLKSPVIEVSAKTNVGINQLFEKVIRKYFEVDKIHLLDNPYKNESAPKEKQTKSHLLIQRNKKKSTPIESQQQTNTRKDDSTRSSLVADYLSNPIIIGMFGGGGCGKTLIALRYLKNEFTEGYIPTIEDEFEKIIDIDGKTISIRIIDTAGQDDFAEMRCTYFTKCSCFILIFSIDNPQSIEDLRMIYSDMSDIVEMDSISVVIAANFAEFRQEGRNDLISPDEYKKIEEEFNAPVIEVSARLNIGIQELFEKVIRQFLDKTKIDNTSDNSPKQLQKKSFWSKHFGKKK